MPRRPSGVRADRGYSYRRLELVATNVRKQLELPPTAPINALRLFEGLDITAQGRKGQHIPIRGNVIDLKNSEGFTRYNRNRQEIEIFASAETYDWLERDYPRGRFFLAHELGHCLLHTNQLVRLAHMPLTQQTALHKKKQLVLHEIYQDTEWQANAFASALLMPASGLLALENKYGKGLSPAEIAKRFCVSAEAANYRLKLYINRKQQLLLARRAERARPSIPSLPFARLKGQRAPGLTSGMPDWKRPPTSR